MSKQRKIYVVGGDTGYASWMQGVIVPKMEDADLVVGVGGSDVGAKYYNQPTTDYLGVDPITDKYEYESFQKAIKLKKKIIGICKSSQWGAALAGGAIFQHVNHPSYHSVTTFDGKKLFTNSTHHNLQDISILKKGIDYELLAWAENLSPFHINGYGKNVECLKEPEVVWYKKTNWLSFQNHNEWLLGNFQFKEVIQWSREILDRFMDDKL
jgi:gamma-glutamyl-gamma-aminobutyrate hydrolase PuuD